MKTVFKIAAIVILVALGIYLYIFFTKPTVVVPTDGVTTITPKPVVIEREETIPVINEDGEIVKIKIDTPEDYTPKVSIHVPASIKATNLIGLQRKNLIFPDFRRTPELKVVTLDNDEVVVINKPKALIDFGVTPTMSVKTNLAEVRLGVGANLVRVGPVHAGLSVLTDFKDIQGSADIGIRFQEDLLIDASYSTNNQFLVGLKYTF